MAKFPEILNTPEDFFIAADKAASALNSGIDDTVMLAEVTDGSVFPTGRFTVTIDNEIIVVASRAGNFLTLEERGAFGTTAAAHIGTALVNATFTAGHWNQMTDALARTQKPLFRLREPVIDSTLADPPGAPADGDQYVVNAPATGAWTGEETKIARWLDDAMAWVFITPPTGTLLYDETSDSYLMFGAGGWGEFGGGGAAGDVEYDNATSGATATDVQGAIDELFENTTGALKFEINLSLTGGMHSGEILGSFLATRPFSLEVNFAGSLGFCTATPDVTQTIDVHKNGVSVGTIDITANAVTFVSAGGATFAQGDTMGFVSGGEAYFDAVGITLLASRA